MRETVRKPERFHRGSFFFLDFYETAMETQYDDTDDERQEKQGAVTGASLLGKSKPRFIVSHEF